jgi:hypothetical protein
MLVVICTLYSRIVKHRPMRMSTLRLLLVYYFVCYSEGYYTPADVSASRLRVPCSSAYSLRYSHAEL